MKKALLLFISLLCFTGLLFPQAVMNYPAAVGVLGQTDFSTITPGSGNNKLTNPCGVAVDPTTGKVFIADRGNNRVLRFSQTEQYINGGIAEAVLGQPNFTTTSLGNSASKMNEPIGLCVDSAGRLWVCDFKNNRVLRFDNASNKASGSDADAVLGHKTFNYSAATLSDTCMNQPVFAYYDNPTGALWVADYGYNRVLKFNNAATKSNGAAADGVLGQSNFTTSTGGLAANKFSGNNSVYVDIYGNLWVSDNTQRRFLKFSNAASKPNGSYADGILGQFSFTTKDTSSSQTGSGYARFVCGDNQGKLFCIQEDYNRIVFFNNSSTLSIGNAADGLFGQPNFNYKTALSPSSQTFTYPKAMAINFLTGDIWVVDNTNSRVLRFTSNSVLPVELVSFTGAFKKNNILLNWNTASEKNNYMFEVERSTANSEFVKIGSVTGHGTTNSPVSYSFTDKSLTGGKYYYRLKQIDLDGKYEYSKVIEVETGNPQSYFISQNYPNPFNPSTAISFGVPEKSLVSIKIFNALGQEIQTLVNETKEAGSYQVSFNASNLTSGIYFYTINAGTFSSTKKMILIK